MGICSSSSGMKDNETYIQAPAAVMKKPVISEIEYEVDMHGAPESVKFVAAYPNIKIKENGKIVREWPLKFIRGYGQVGDIFSFETGRSCPEGPRVYYLKVKGKKDIFVGLNDIVAIHTSDGKGANRYLEHGKPKEISDSEYSKLSRGQGLSEDTYSTMAQLSANFYNHIGTNMHTESAYDVARHQGQPDYDVSVEYDNPNHPAPVYSTDYDSPNKPAPVYDAATTLPNNLYEETNYNVMQKPNQNPYSTLTPFAS